jgi:NAD(P)-dependent dehydrogenase (short-subunit alcohol dehydrogenase family)
MDTGEQDRKIVGQMCPERSGSVFIHRRALVVGGSGGIGRAISLGLAARGALPIIHGRDSAKVQALVGEIRKAGGEAEGFSLDLEEPRRLDALVKAILEKAKESARNQPIDILICAFGPFVQKPFIAHDACDWEKTALLNLALPGALASSLFSSMCAQGFGRILFLGGTRTDSIHGYKSNAAYAAAKTGLGVVAKSLAMEGAAHNVASVVVCPGFVETEYLSPALKNSLIAASPDGRLIQPFELASLALDLLDRDPCPSSGAVVSFDAGFSPCGFDNPGARR